MSRLLIFVNPAGFESVWKERGDSHPYELVIVDASRQLVDSVVAVEVPEWYANLDAFLADGVRRLARDAPG